MDNQPNFFNDPSIPLPPDHVNLAQQLAEHTHHRWVESLLDLGWRYGPQLDVANLTHPYLRPFSDLPDTVRQERLHLHLDNLKAVLGLGYSFTQTSQTQAFPAIETPAGTAANTDHPLNPTSLTSLLAWRRELLNSTTRTPDLYCVLGDKLLKLGEPLMAYDLLNEGLAQWPEHLRLQQLLALSLARSGAPQVANQILRRLVQSGAHDEQTLGLLARTDKDLWRQSHDPALRSQHLDLAARGYLQAYRLSDSLWTGINAATMALLKGETQLAHQVARAVLTQGEQKLAEAETEGKDAYWILATLGEAELILEHWQAAENHYKRAVHLGQGRFGDLCSSYRNAALLMQHYGAGEEQLNQWFQMPRVIVFCGHRIDEPNRSIPRFPPHLEKPVFTAIRERLQQTRGQVGYASAASGSDILFLEAILSIGGECNIVLPYERERFMADSVIPAGSNWLERCNRVMGAARELVIASESKPPDNATSYEYSNRLLHGLAQIRARQLHTELIPMAVWNGQPGDGPGGTASTVSYWRQWTPSVEVIDIASLLQQTGQAVDLNRHSISKSPSTWLSEPEYQREIRALLFADVVHYTQLADEQLFAFTQKFLAAVSDLTAKPGYRPLMKNTWGDALYYVFASVREAGLFALELSALMTQTRWEQAGLPHDLNVRIALHAGPVFRSHDPVTGQINYIGTHVNHAARIEPVTPPGKVYASQAFSAIAASEGIREFACDYVGQMPWAKHYGTFPTFHVHQIQ